MSRSHGLPPSRIRGRRPVTWTTILGLVLVPLTVAGVLVWGLWNPTERLDAVTAAVVNHDEPVEVDGQTVLLGRLLAGELIGDGEDPSGSDDANFTWVLTDEDDAEAGLDDGRYMTVVTIPENFSSAATSASASTGSEDAAPIETASIDIRESDRGRLIDTGLSNIVTQTATQVLNRQLGAQFVGGVFVGMNELGHGIGEAADGALRLADGGARLADGASEFAGGTRQLADGAQQLSAGAAQLSGGTGSLAAGASELSAGVGGYVDGASALAQAYTPLGAGATAAATQLRTTVGALAQFQAESAAPQQRLAEGLTAVGGAMDPGMGLPADIAALTENCYASGASAEFCAQLQATLGNRAEQIGAGLATVDAALTGPEGLNRAQQNLQANLGAGAQPDPGVDPIAQLDQLIAGLDAFGTGLGDFATQGSQLVSGAGALSSGASELASGASELSSGTSQLAANTPALAEGASQLADGAGKSAAGAGDLSRGLGEAAAEIPRTGEAERERLAETAVAPVEARGGSGELFNASGVPLFVGVALWAGALATFLVLSPLWRRTREAARGIGAITVRSALPATLLGGVQGVIAGVVLPIALGYDLGQAARFFGLALLAGVTFALVVQGLSALLGGFGRFIAFALLVVAFAVGIVSTVPGPLAAVGDASPIGAALGGFQAIAAGASGSGPAAAALVLWALGGLLLTGLAVRKARSA